MAVQFRETSSTFDHLLGPVLARDHGPAGAVLLSVLVKGLANGVAPEDIRLWIKSRATEGSRRVGVHTAMSQHGFDEQPAEPSDGAAVTRSSPPLVELVNNGPLWSHFCKAAERKVLSSPSVTGDVRGSHLSTARKLYAGLLLPLPHGDGLLYKRNLNARVALANVGLTMLNDNKGWDTAIYTQPRLAMMTGGSPRTAWESLSVLDRIGVLGRISKKGANGRFRMSALNGESRDGIRGFKESIEALVDGVPDLISEVVRSVTHPAWSYSATLNHGHWLTLLADVADVSVQTFRMRPVIEKPIRATLEAEHLMPATVIPYLVEILDRIADDPAHGRVDPTTGDRVTARAAHANALANYEDAACARGEASIKYKKNKRNAHVVLADLLAERRIPKPPHLGSPNTAEARTDQVSAWRSSMREVIVIERPNSDFKSVGGTALRGILQRRGYGPVFADKTVRYIMHGEDLSQMTNGRVGSGGLAPG